MVGLLVGYLLFHYGHALGWNAWVVKVYVLYSDSSESVLPWLSTPTDQFLDTFVMQLTSEQSVKYESKREIYLWA